MVKSARLLVPNGCLPLLSWAVAAGDAHAPGTAALHAVPRLHSAYIRDERARFPPVVKLSVPYKREAMVY